MSGYITAAYHALPGLAAFVLAALAFAALFLTDALDTLKPWKKTRWTLAVVITLVGLGGLLADSDERISEKSKGDADRKELMDQIRQLIVTAQVQATRDDVTRLGSSVSSGFERMTLVFNGGGRRTAAIKSGSKLASAAGSSGAASGPLSTSPKASFSGSATGTGASNENSDALTADSNVTADSKATADSGGNLLTDSGQNVLTDSGGNIVTSSTVKLDPSLVGHVHVIQRPAPSSNPQLPYALQVIVQTDLPTLPVSFAFVCTGAVGGMTYFVAGQPASSFTDLMVNAGQGKITAAVRFSYPLMTPQAPLVVTLFSKTEIRVVQLQKATQ